MAADGTQTRRVTEPAAARQVVQAPGLGRTRWVAAVRGVLRRHALLVVLLLAGAAGRLLVLLTFRPALEYLQDSYDYLLNAQHLQPGVVRPLLYPVALRTVGLVGGLGMVPLAQHLAGLAMAVLLYVALCRAGARPWLAALGVAPLLLDGYQLDIEQFVLSETLFQSLIVVAVACLLWRDRPSGVLAAAAGLALAGAALTRDLGLVLLAGPVVLLAVRRVGWRPLAAFGAAAVVPLLAYGGWFASVHGSFGLQRYSGIMFASRAMTVADCRQVHVPAYERSLCVALPPARRQSADWYASHPSSPLRRLRPPAGLTHEAVAADFARRVITAQPQAYARVVGGDLAHYLSWTRSTSRGDDPLAHWQFAGHRLPARWYPLRPPLDPYRDALPPIGGAAPAQSTLASYGLHGQRLAPQLWKAGQSWLAGYQRVVFTPGPVLAACLALSVAAGVGRLPAGLRRLRWDALFLTGSGAGLLLVTSLTAVFQYRYLLPVLVLLPAGGALGMELLVRRAQPARAAAVGKRPSRPAVLPSRWGSAMAERVGQRRG